jgi:hypothetical protein
MCYTKRTVFERSYVRLICKYILCYSALAYLWVSLFRDVSYIEVSKICYTGMYFNAISPITIAMMLLFFYPIISEANKCIYFFSLEEKYIAPRMPCVKDAYLYLIGFSTIRVMKLFSPKFILDVLWYLFYRTDLSALLIDDSVVIITVLLWLVLFLILLFKNFNMKSGKLMIMILLLINPILRAVPLINIIALLPDQNSVYSAIYKSLALLALFLCGYKIYIHRDIL